VPHCTPVPVDFRYCPLVPLDAPAVRVPVSVALSRVTAVMVDTVVPEVITVVPIVGARYPAGAACHSSPVAVAELTANKYPLVAATVSWSKVDAPVPTSKSPFASKEAATAAAALAALTAAELAEVKADEADVLALAAEVAAAVALAAADVALVAAAVALAAALVALVAAAVAEAAAEVADVAAALAELEAVVA